MPTLRLVPSGPTRRPLSRMRTAASAYRADIAIRGSEDAFCKNDGIWIAVGSMLSTAANMEDSERAAKIVQDALELAKEALGAERLARGNRLDPPGRRRMGPGDVMRLLADEAEGVGALNSAALILDAFIAADRSVEGLDLGRIIAQQARIARNQGEDDLALSRYKETERLGRSLEEDELRLRAWIGYGLLAQRRGNFPVVRRWMNRAAERAEQVGMPSFASQAHHTLMSAAGRNGDIDTAIVEGWKALQFARGDDRAETDVLGNLGSVLLLAQHSRAAKAAYLSVLGRPLDLSQALPVLGGLAMAAAAESDFKSAKWAVSEVRRLTEQETLPYPTAEAFIDCAEALFRMGATTEAQSMLRAAETICRKRSYHQFTFRIESIASGQRTANAAPRALAPEAAVIARDISNLMPATAPERVELLAMAS